jgi:hypothetical protein
MVDAFEFVFFRAPLFGGHEVLRLLLLAFSDSFSALKMA